MKNYMVIDLGTGNSRIAIVSSNGQIYGIKSFENIYYKDENYEDAQYFLPYKWQEKILNLCRKLLQENKNIEISAITSTGARQSIVLYDDEGKAFYGLPNIDNRGGEWIKDIKEKDYIYEKTGRWVTKDFPASKILGFKKVYPQIYEKISKITSISEWLGEVFTGKIAIEYSQACETQLFDIDTNSWSDKICKIYEIDKKILPDLIKSKELLGKIKKEIGDYLNISDNIDFIISGADTQVAIKGAGMSVGDIGLVSGTTSPIVAIVDNKYYDKYQRCWTNSNLGGNTYIVETNPGVTGLNYQRFKNNFFADFSYKKLDEIIENKTEFYCTASFTTLYFSQKRALRKSGFIMNSPLNKNIDNTDLLYAIIADIASSIYLQYLNICNLVDIKKDYIIGCGGGLQSCALCQMISDLTKKKLLIKKGFEQSSIRGSLKICNEFYDIISDKNSDILKEYFPQENKLIEKYYKLWFENRALINPK